MLYEQMKNWKKITLAMMATCSLAMFSCKEIQNHVKVVREQMCSEKTLSQVHDLLENVVSATNGTGKDARVKASRLTARPELHG